MESWGTYLTSRSRECQTLINVTAISMKLSQVNLIPIG
jgi:hypothetical protein